MQTEMTRVLTRASPRTNETSEPASAKDERLGAWTGRPRAARALGIGLAVAPILTGATAAYLAAHIYPEPRAAPNKVVWWTCILVVSIAFSVVTERLARRA